MTHTQSANFPLFMDISRLLARAGHSVPTGIDRTEYEYAAYLDKHWGDSLVFVAYHPIRGICPVDHSEASRFLSLTAALWNGENVKPTVLKWMARKILFSLSFSHAITHKSHKKSSAFYLLLSHHHLMKEHAIQRFLGQTKARLVVMIHDIIPIEFPEYSRPGEDKRHLQRLKTVAKLANAVIVPTESVKQSLRPFMPAQLPIQTIAHGLHMWGLEKTVQNPNITIPSKPYFVCIGTIEPRKNHLLLLNIWRNLAQSLGKDTPQLIIIGRRGWENENILDMLERCPALQDNVKEYNALNDQQVVHLLRHARALLFPSFTEGFGLPLLEALAVQTPVVCSDISVFKEVAGTAATCLDPLDGPAWTRAIIDLGSCAENKTRKDRTSCEASATVSPWPSQVQLGLEFLNVINLVIPP